MSAVRVDGGICSHLVLARASRIPCGIGSIKLIIDLDIQIPFVLVIRLVRQESSYTLALFHREHLSEVEHSLFPVRVLGMGACRESNGFVACGEINVEPSNQRVNEIVTLTP